MPSRGALANLGHQPLLGGIRRQNVSCRDDPADWDVADRSKCVAAAEGRGGTASRADNRVLQVRQDSSGVTVVPGPCRLSNAHCCVAAQISRKLLMQALLCDVVRAWTQFGMAITASNPMSATTIIISTRVNPLTLNSLLFILVLPFRRAAWTWQQAV